MTATKKRGRSMFDAVQKIETEDAMARTKRRATSVQLKAASQAALSQQAIYGKLLEVRILLQRALQPKDESLNEKDDKTDDALEKCTDLLAMLLEAREKLSQKEDVDSNLTKLKSIVNDKEQLEEKLQKEFEREEESWKEVLNRRHKEVRLHAGLAAKSQFRVLDSSFWEQVESTVRHDTLQQKKDETKAGFDDSKIYQMLLKEFVTNHPSTEGESRAHDRLRSAGTRRTVNKVDRRASKGRRLRYTPIPKLVNFTFPLSRPAAILDEDAWFQSLFGGAATKKKTS
eukprot:scaffold1953_cov176-Amphora_coffeaeformis.AAC.39